METREPAQATPAQAFRLLVLNPGGRDPDQSFPDGAGIPDPNTHPPVNYHAYAACTGGTFRRRLPDDLPPGQPALVLLRRNLKASLRAVASLNKRGCRTAIVFKEAGRHQVADLLGSADRLRIFLEICDLAGAILAPTTDLVPLCQSVGGESKPARFLPTPYPVGDSRWDFSVPAGERRGIFAGTREFGVPSRCHAAALLFARELSRRTGEPVTVFNSDGGRGKNLLRQMQFPAGALEVIARPLPYPDYLRVLARHKCVVQLDRSAVPGQVAGDALLCRLPCIGGDSAIERIAFPGLNGHDTPPPGLLDRACRILTDPAAREAAVARSHEIASRELSFPALARQLNEFFDAIAPPPHGNPDHPQAP